MKNVELAAGYKKSRANFYYTFITFILCLSIMGRASLLMAETADERYGQAAQKYQEGHLPEAYKLLSDNLKANPDHISSLVLIAKILYRMEKFSEAAKYFDRVDLKLLDADTTFEYGVAMYGAKRCDDALSAFVNLPKSHRYQSYARFYSGACYLQKGQYNKALIKLRKATGLPPMLNAMRRNLIAVTRQQISKQSQITTTPPASTETMAPVGKPARSQKQSQSQQAPQSPLSVDLTPSLEVTYGEAYKNYHDYKIEDWSATGTTGNITLNGKYELASGTRGPNPYFGLFLNAKHFDQTAVMPTSTLILDGTTGEYSWKDENPAQPRITTEEYTAAPSLTLPFTTKSSLTTKFEYWYKKTTDPWAAPTESHRSSIGALHSNFAAIDVDSDLGINYTEHQNAKQLTDEYDTTYSLGLSKNVQVFDFDLAFSHLTRNMAGGVPYGAAAAETKGGASVTIPIEKFSLFAGAEHLVLTPAPGQDYVNEQKMAKTNLTLSLERGFEFGLTLKAIGGYEMFNELSYKDLPVGDINVDDKTAEKRIGLANGTVSSAALSVSQSLFNLVSLGASVKHQIVEYQISDMDIAPAFYKKAPDQITEWSITLGLKKTF